VRYKKFIESNTRILFNADLFETAPVELFEQPFKLQASAAGKLRRGTVLFFSHNDIPMVLKHYHRGGLLSKLVADTYSRYTLPLNQAPRMWAEFSLLASLRQLGLPVPEPLAARCLDTSRFTYRGDLITRQICNTQTLAERLQQTALTSAEWRSIGQTIARFHHHRVYHADLNAHNILLDDAGHSYLIDFDKCGIQPADTSRKWMQGNLGRLQRSLRKVLERNPVLHYHESDWQLLLQGYDKPSHLPAFQLKPDQNFF
jgi:3-deoxy-D-manno-octulosonic acid kinase